MRKFTSVFFSVLLAIMLVETAIVPSAVPVLATSGVQVSINAPEFVAPGSNFTATVDITSVTSLGSANYTVSFNSTVIQLYNIESGFIGATQIPVDSFTGSEGTYTVNQSVIQAEGASGPGSLAVLFFHVIGDPDTSSDINLSNGILFDKTPAEITAAWLPGSVSILPPPGGPHHFDFDFIGPQDAEMSFPITIRAKDSFNGTDTLYNAINTLSDSTGTIVPNHTDNFTNGVWTGDVTIFQPYQGNVITTSGGGSGGISNSFDVVDAVQADFHLATTQNTFMLAAGENITTSFDVTSMNDFEGTVNLYFHGPPVIEDASGISPTSVSLTAGETEAVTLILGAGTQTPAGTYGCEIEGMSDNFSDELFLTVNVGAAGQPLLMASPGMVALGENVTFSVYQFPPGETVEILWGDGPLAGTVLASGTATDGTWTSDPVTITGNITSGDYMIKAVSVSAIAHFNITIIGAGEDFLVNLTPNFLSLMPGDVFDVDVNIKSVGGFNSEVNLSAYTPPDVTCTFAQSSVTPPSNGQVSVTMTVTVEDWAIPDMYYVGVEFVSQDPPIQHFRDLMLDINPPGEWGPSMSLSQSYGVPGNLITITGSNFMGSIGEIVTIREIFSGTVVDTEPPVIYVSEDGTFNAQFTVPEVPPGNYRLEARVNVTNEFSEKDFQIMGADASFSVSVSPWSTNVVTEPGKNSSTVSVSLFSIGGSSPTVNLYLEGTPPWLTYKFGSLAENTPATGSDAITIPAGGSKSVILSLTASLTAPADNYWFNIKVEDASTFEHQFVGIEYIVMPPGDSGMAGVSLNPETGLVGADISVNGWGFTPGSDIVELQFAGTNVLSGNVSVSATGSFSTIITVPDEVFGGPAFAGTYPVDVMDSNGVWGGSSFTIIEVGQKFTLSVNPDWLPPIPPGGSDFTTVTVKSMGSEVTVTLSVEHIPSGVDWSFSQTTVTVPPGGSASSALTISPTNIPPGWYGAEIKGIDTNDNTFFTHLEFEVMPPEGFVFPEITLNPNSGPANTKVTVIGTNFPPGANVTGLWFGGDTVSIAPVNAN
ncbi:hypothetical protein ACFLUY_00400, partial [Chloroflexota bacterium]